MCHVPVPILVMKPTVSMYEMKEWDLLLLLLLLRGDDDDDTFLMKRGTSVFICNFVGGGVIQRPCKDSQ